MTDKQIYQLPAAASVNSTDQFAIDNSGNNTQKVTASQILTYMQNTLTSLTTLNITAGTVPANGLYLAVADQLAISSNTKEVMRFKSTGAAVNFLLARSEATGIAPSIATASATDANVGFSLKTQGTGAFSFVTASTLQQFGITSTASAVNYINVTGSATTVNPILSILGTDTNAGLTVQTKGTGAYVFATNSGAQQQFGITHTATAVNYLSVTGAIASSSPVISAIGSDTNIDITATPKGTGLLSTTGIKVTGSTIPTEGAYLNAANTLGLSARSLVALTITNPASAVNYFAIVGAATANNPSLSVTGTDTNIAFNQSSKGNLGFNFYTNALAQLQLAIAHTATAVNYWSLTGAATTANPTLSILGSDTNIGANIILKGTGGLGVGFSGAVTGAFHVKQATGGTAIATFRDDGNTADLTIKTTAANALQILAGSGDSLEIATAGGTGVSFDINKNVTQGSVALATNATNGFLWLTSCPGAPTGAATAPYTLASALIYDSTNNKIYVRCNGTWRSTLALT